MRMRNSFNEAQLALPLFWSNLDQDEDSNPTHDTPFLGRSDQEPEEEVSHRPVSELYAWTNEDLLALVDGFFRASLQALGKTGNPDEKAEVLKWIMAPRKTRLVIRDTIKAIETDRIPWSFRWACKLLGHSADRLQGQIEARLAAQRRGHALNVVH